MCFETTADTATTTTPEFTYPTSPSDFDSPAVFNAAMMQYFNADDDGKVRFFNNMTRDVFDLFSIGMATYIMMHAVSPAAVEANFDFTVQQSREFAAHMLIKYYKDFA